MIYTVRIDSFMSKSALLSILPHVQHMHPEMTLTIELKIQIKYRFKTICDPGAQTRHKGPFFKVRFIQLYITNHTSMEIL